MSDGQSLRALVQRQTGCCDLQGVAVEAGQPLLVASMRQER